MTEGQKSVPEIRASSTLLSAAFAGLMGAGLVACASKEEEKIVKVEPLGAIISKVTDETINLASFTATCETRGGLVQTHASCAGANSCAGLSFHASSSLLSEHSCKATNICAGMSCVDLAKGADLSGKAILEGSDGGEMVGSATQCSFCHGPGTASFQLPIPPAANAAEAVAAFQAKSDKALLAAIAFGIHGVNPSSGIAYANMPGFYKSYSLAEMKGLVTHLRSLPIEAKAWTDPQ